MKVKEILLILLIRVLILFSVGFVALTLVPNLAQFPYLDRLSDSHVPSWIYSWGNFDGAHYVSIAKKGYEEFEQAFFPLYPLLIRLVSSFINNYVLSGLLVSNIAFIFGAIWFVNFTEKAWSKNMSKWSLAFLLSYPTAFYFSGLYSEALFFACTVGALYYAYDKKYLPAGILAGLSASARVQGIFILIPLIGILYAQNSLKKKSRLLILPFLGLGAYMLYLNNLYGDPLLFYRSIEIYGEQRSTSLVLLPQVYYRYVKIFFQSDLTFQYFVSVLEFASMTLGLILAVIFAWKGYLKRKWVDISLGLFSLSHLILPSLTGSFSSVPRYSLFALTTYFCFAQLKSTKVKSVVIVIFSLLQIVLLSFFIQGRFIS